MKQTATHNSVLGAEQEEPGRTTRSSSMTSAAQAEDGAVRYGALRYGSVRYEKRVGAGTEASADAGPAIRQPGN